MEDYTGQGVNGYRGNVTFDVNRQGPRSVKVAEDGMVYVCDNNSTTSGIWRMNPNNPTADFVPMLDVSKRNTTFTIISAIEPVGKGSDLTLYTIDGTTDNYAGNIYQYPVGTTTNYSAAPAVFVANSSSIGLEETTSSNMGQSICADGRGGFWICQAMRGYSNQWEALLHLNASGIRDYALYDHQDVLGNPTYNISYRGAMALSHDKTLMAMTFDKKIAVLRVSYDPSTGVPSLTKLYQTPILGTNIDGAAFDYAGNLYALSASVERLYVFAPIKSDNSCLTPAKTANTITITATENYERNVTAGNFGTICLPYSVRGTNITGAEVYKVISFSDNDKGGLLLEKVDKMQAGKPYFFQSSASPVNFVYVPDVLPASASAENGLHGTISGLSVDGSGNYVLQNNTLCQTTGGAVTVGTNRAWLVYNEVPLYGSAPAPAPGARRRVMNIQAVATALQDIQHVQQETPRKILINGQLYIINNEKTYNAQGMIIK